MQILLFLTGFIIQRLRRLHANPRFYESFQVFDRDNMAYSDIWDTHERLLYSPDEDTPEEFLIGTILESISFLPYSSLTRRGSYFTSSSIPRAQDVDPVQTDFAPSTHTAPFSPSPLVPDNAPIIVSPLAPDTQSIHATTPKETGELVTGDKHLPHEQGLLVDKRDKNISNNASSLPLYERLVKKRMHSTGPDIRFPNSRTVTITPMARETLPYRSMRTLAGYSTGGYGYSDGYAVGYPAGTGVYASAVPSGFQAYPGKVKRYSNKYDDSKHASFGAKPPSFLGGSFHFLTGYEGPGYDYGYNTGAYASSSYPKYYDGYSASKSVPKYDNKGYDGSYGAESGGYGTGYSAGSGYSGGYNSNSGYNTGSGYGSSGAGYFDSGLGDDYGYLGLKRPAVTIRMGDMHINAAMNRGGRGGSDTGTGSVPSSGRTGRDRDDQHSGFKIPSQQASMEDFVEGRVSVLPYEDDGGASGKLHGVRKRENDGGRAWREAEVRSVRQKNHR